jgi:hypothetical protein
MRFAVEWRMPLLHLQANTMTLFRTALASALLFASAAAGAHDFAAYTEASTQLAQRTAEAVKLHRMPRASDPAVGKLIATMSDDKRFLGGAAFRAEDLPGVMEMCDAANRANMAYIMFDLGSYVDKSMNDRPLRVATITQKVMAKNALMFQDEMALLTSFGQRCLSREVVLLADFVKTLKPEQMTGVRLEGLAQVRRGIYTGYVGTATAANATAVSLDNRKKMFDAMAEVAPVFAEVLEPAERKKIRDFALATKAKVPRELSAQLQQIIDAMGITRCEDLCRYSTQAAPAQ